MTLDEFHSKYACQFMHRRKDGLDRYKITCFERSSGNEVYVTPETLEPLMRLRLIEDARNGEKVGEYLKTKQAELLVHVAKQFDIIHFNAMEVRIAKIVRFFE